MEQSPRNMADERDLLAAALAGDECAFGNLIDAHRRGLEVYCYLMLGSPNDAREVVEETVLRAWGRRERVEPRASARLWLFRIATNACLDELERRDR